MRRAGVCFGRAVSHLFSLESSLYMDSCPFDPTADKRSLPFLLYDHQLLGILQLSSSFQIQFVMSLPKTYKALRQTEKGKPFDLIDVEMKQPQAGQVVVKVLACGGEIKPH